MERTRVLRTVGPRGGNLFMTRFCNFVDDGPPGSLMTKFRPNVKFKVPYFAYVTRFLFFALGVEAIGGLFITIVELLTTTTRPCFSICSQDRSGGAGCRTSSSKKSVLFRTQVAAVHPLSTVRSRACVKPQVHATHTCNLFIANT